MTQSEYALLKFYKQWSGILFFTTFGLVLVSAVYESKWELDERKLNSPEYQNCQAALKQCNIVNETKETPCK